MRKDTLKIKEAIRKLGVKQTNLADKLGISRQSLNDWLNKADMPDKYFQKICEELNLEPSEYLMGEGDLIELSFFAYYSNGRIVYSKEVKKVSREDCKFGDLKEEEIKNKFFIYHINKDLSFVLRKEGLIIFEKIDPVEIKDLKSIQDHERVNIILLDSGEILRVKDEYIFRVDTDDPITLKDSRVIGIARFLLNVSL